MDRINVGGTRFANDQLEEILPGLFIKLPKGYMDKTTRPRNKAASELFIGFKTALDLAYRQITEVGKELARIKIAPTRNGRIFNEEAVESRVGPPPPNFANWAEAAVFAESVLNAYGLSMTRWQDVQKVKIKLKNIPLG